MKQHIKILPLWITFLFEVTSSSIISQVNYGQMKLSVIQDNYHQIWKEFSLTNLDTTFFFYLDLNKNSSIFDSIPQGKYTLSLFSELNDKIELQVKIFKTSKYKINTKGFYHIDKSKSTFISQLTNNDTLKIFVEEMGCFHKSFLYCKITKQDSIYFIHFNTNNREIKHSLTKSEIHNLIQIESIGRKSKYIYNSTLSSYYWLSIDKKLIKFKINGTNYILQLYSELLNNENKN